VTSTSLVDVDDLADIRRLLDQAGGSERLRPIGLREVVSGPAALAVLPTVLARLGVAGDATVAVLSDDVAKACRDRPVLDVVTEMVARRSFVQRVVLRGRGSQGVHADESTVEHAVAAVASLAPGVLVTVGSGTMADIGKVVAQRLDLAHVVVQTAASVNGFADDQSVLLRNGTKRTTPSRWPEALVVDSDVLSASPLAMTRSGLGDLLSTYTAAADWRLASIVGFDPSYSPTAVAMLRSGIDEAVACADGLRTNEPSAVRTLAWALTRGGLAMGIAGRTSPSSGAEHTISHLLEMKANAGQQIAAPHGAQVGAATVVVARVWAMLRERLRAGRFRVAALDETELGGRVARAFLPLDPSGAVAAECWSAYERKLSWINGHLPELRAVCEEWERYDAAIGALLAEPAALSGTLRAAGAAATLTELDPAPSRHAARWAVANCHLMRDRFTIVDLAEVTGCWGEDDVDEALR
jgi:glycerol-1-phosphate dehydrogenase [NAD(P)+]